MFIRNKVGLTSYKVLAIYWAVFLVVLFSTVVKHFATHTLSFDSLQTQPSVTYDEVVADAIDQLHWVNHYRIVVAVGVPTKHASEFEKTVRTLRNHWQPHPALTPIAWTRLDSQEIDNFYRPMAAGLMTMHDQVQLLRAPEAEVALEIMKKSSAEIATQDDPLGYYARWLKERSPHSTMLADEEILQLQTPNFVWSIIRFQASEDLRGLNPVALTRNIENLEEAATALNPEARVLIRGTLFDAALVASQNYLDLAALVGIIVVAFGLLIRAWTENFRTGLFYFFCFVSGLLGGLSATIIIFGIVSIWTALLAIAFAGISFALTAYLTYTHRRHATLDAVQCVEEALPALIWITLAICAGFTPLWFAPIAVWQEFGVFMIAATLTTAITLTLTYHYFTDRFEDKGLNEEKWFRLSFELPRFALKRWQRSAQEFESFFVLTGLILLVGFFTMTFSEETNTFVTAPTTQEAGSQELSELLRLPRTHQFFLVTTHDADNTLMAEEALRMSFIERKMSPEMTLMSVSEWMPSKERFRSVVGLKHAQYEKNNINFIDSDSIAPRPEFESWLISDAANETRHLWLGEKNKKTSSIVTVSGLNETNSSSLYQLSDSLSGAQYIDTIAMQKEQLAQSRFIAVGLFTILAVSSITISLFHYGLYCWRMAVPPMVGALATPALLSWGNATFSLTTALAMSVVYGIGFALALIYQTHRNCGPKTLALFNYTALAILTSFVMLALVDIAAFVDFGTQCTVGIVLSAMTTFVLRAPSHIRENFR